MGSVQAGLTSKDLFRYREHVQTVHDHGYSAQNAFFGQKTCIGLHHPQKNLYENGKHNPPRQVLI
jgi:hypothetical protein